MEQIARHINTLGNFCGIRDVDELTPEKLDEKYHIEEADVMVLFGGSILAGGDVLAKAMQKHVAKKYIIVGGAGHTTETLRQYVRKEYPSIETDALPEAEVFNRYLNYVYGFQADYLETRSTNCGNNITYLLELLSHYQITCSSIILCQDATMQNRMDAGLRKYVPDMQIINYASYRASVTVSDNRLSYLAPIHGMWNIERYVNLLMGEIPRLTDNADGYGPSGKDFIAHVEIPPAVQSAFDALKPVFGNKIREADPQYASPVL